MSADTEQATPEPVEAAEATLADEQRWLEMGEAEVRATLPERLAKLEAQAAVREAQITPERYAAYERAGRDEAKHGAEMVRLEAKGGEPFAAASKAWAEAADAVEKLGNEIRYNDNVARELRAEAADIANEDGPTFKRLAQDARDRIRRAETVAAASKRRRVTKAERAAEGAAKSAARMARLKTKGGTP